MEEIYCFLTFKTITIWSSSVYREDGILLTLLSRCTSADPGGGGRKLGET